ncbi:MAG TPA: hypothetical protein PLB81_00215 [Deltaproteobacteria bacterium]|nr:hypothetical protein [Deltaproteobacteria bacterium]
MKQSVVILAIAVTLGLSACAPGLKYSNQSLFQDYGREVIVTPFVPGSIDDYFRTTSRQGLLWDEGWLSASLQSASGKRYGLVRGYEKTHSNIIISFTMRDDLAGVSTRLFKKLYTGKIAFDRIDGKDAAIVKSYPARHSFEIQLGVHKIHWREEGGVVDLEFESLGPALSYYFPGVRIKEGLYYTAEVFRCTGTIRGERVSGYGSLDQAWLPRGMDWFQSKGFLFFEDLWLVWANRYRDGSTDYGVVISGPENWNVCFAVDGTEVTAPTENAVAVTWAPQGYPARVDVTMDHGQRQFQWHCQRRILEVKGMALWANGQMVNLARKEPPVEGYAWVEGITFHRKHIPYPLARFGSRCLMHLPDSLKSRIYERMFLSGMQD